MLQGEFEQAGGVFGEEFAGDLWSGRKAADGAEGLGALAGGATAESVVAIAAVEKFVLMPFEESAGVLFVAEKGIEAGARGKIAVHIRIIAEQTVGQPAGSDLAFGVEDSLFMFGIDVAPPGLSVADEGDLGKFFEDFVETFDAEVVGVVLKMHQDWDFEFLGQFSEFLEFGRVTVHVEFLFADADGALAKEFLDDLGGIRLIGDFIGEKNKLIGMFYGELLDGFIAAAFGVEAEPGTGGEEDGFGDAEGALMVDQLLISAPAVIGMLMDIDDRFAVGCSSMEEGTGSGEGGSGEESAPADGGLIHGLVMT